MNGEIRLRGRQLLDESIALRTKKLIYPKQYNGALLHAGVDASSHLITRFGSFPRLFFTATQGGSGKSRSTEVSYLFVQNPVAVNSSSGNGLIKMLNDPDILRPTLLVDEAQDYWSPSGNATIRSLLNSYTDAWPRVIADDADPRGYIEQRVFYAVVMNGLTNKKYCNIPENFLERCIEIKLPKRLPEEEIDDWVFSDEKEVIGDSLRLPWMEWAKQITKDDIKVERERWLHKYLNSKGIRDRHEETFRPMLEVLYCCGDEYFEEGVKVAQYFIEHPDVTLSIELEVLSDIHWIVDKHEYTFLFNHEMIRDLKDKSDTWNYFGKDGLRSSDVKKMLKTFGIEPERDSTGDHRGYPLGQFKDPWLRLLKLDMPPHLKEHFK
jgi:hypothetical protein